jgi:hypothetical protein
VAEVESDGRRASWALPELLRAEGGSRFLDSLAHLNEDVGCGHQVRIDSGNRPRRQASGFSLTFDVSWKAHSLGSGGLLLYASFAYGVRAFEWAKKELLSTT